MKKQILVYGIVLLSVFVSCRKSENTPDKTKPDNISFEQFNKTIIATAYDSIPGCCKYIIFNITGDLTNGYEAYLSSNSIPILCDGGDQFLVDEKTNQIKVLTENTKISENGTWTHNTKLYLDQFAGQGEKYIGSRMLSYPSGEYIYHYGWIKIKLSANKDTLTILNRATNQTEFNNLLTGQIN